MTAKSNQLLVVVVLVPIAVGVPAVFVFVPPPMTLTPATLPSLVQFTSLMLRLGAVASVFLDGFVKLMFGVNNPALAAVVVFGVKPRYCSEKQSCGQYGS
jgi:hypothetical protein